MQHIQKTSWYANAKRLRIYVQRIVIAVYYTGYRGLNFPLKQAVQ